MMVNMVRAGFARVVCTRPAPSALRRFVLVAALALIAGCASRESSSLPERVTTSDATSSVDGSDIVIATFNIQVFGETKREKSDVMAVLVDEVRKFDIVAIQEVRDSTSTTVQFFVDKINAETGPRFAAVEGPRVGRTSSKEQYAYIYNTERVGYIDGSAYTYDDLDDRFEREPYIAKFQASGFSFVLIDIHTKPDDAANEIDALADVANDALERYRGEQDVVVLGDFNADCDYFDPANGQSALQTTEYLWIVPDDADTTSKTSTNCAYDRIVIRAAHTSEDYSEQWGIIRFDLDHGLSAAKTAEVSDHFPVWAQFRIRRDTDGLPSS